MNGPFASSDITVGPDGRPRVAIWNLGTREVEGVVTEFATVPAGLPVTPEHLQPIGVAAMAIIPANGSVVVTCNSPWRRSTHADLLLVVAYHPERDPVVVPWDAIRDRHVGQMNYPWVGSFGGALPRGPQVAVQIRPTNGGLYRVKLFQEVNGRLPSHPDIDRVMAPTGHSFRWLEVRSGQKELWELAMADNDRMAVRFSSGAEAVAGMLNRSLT